MMKKFFSMMTIAAACMVLFSCDETDDAQQFTLSANSLLSGATDSCYLSTDKTNLEGYYYRDDISLPPFEMSHSFSDYGFGYGFTYCNLKNDSTPGYMNVSAYTAKGKYGDSYFTVCSGGEAYGIPTEISFTGNKSYNAKGMFVTNSTYAYLALKNHDDGHGEYAFVKQWTSDDWFLLTITGIGEANDTTGVVTFKLADGLNIVNDWEYVDLTKLGRVSKITFSLSSTDNGQFGMNTPSYFAMDALTVTE